ncbi:MAG: hypothetical protein AB7S26_21575 [Sandaracinaceae bacterium]
MSAELLAIEPLNLEQLTAQVDGGNVLRLRGSISLRAPSETLGPFFRSVHRACVADGIRELSVDLTALSFMNSSSIRVLITWLDWIVAEPPERQYVLAFRTNPSATWQSTTFSVLKTLGDKHVRVTSG